MIEIMSRINVFPRPMRTSWSLALLLFCTPVSADGQEAPGGLTFELHERDATVNLQWQGEDDLVLQRSSNMQTWEALFATRGEGTHVEPRQNTTVFYRLARLPDPENPGTEIRNLEWRLTQMTINQIERAVNPTVNWDVTFGETPPDDGDAEFGLNLFGGAVPYAWATQPGLIRVYTADQPGFKAAFKLYSSSDSVASSPADLGEDEAGVRQWKTAPDRFTDLNAPHTQPDGSLRYPILDPRALGLGIEGFAYPNDETIGSRANESLPMPAEWLYVLQDGSLGTLDAQGLWVGDGTASESNPIVARMAYWADDETSKLNVNVASEGIPWDVPRADTEIERNYAAKQPVKGEIQRYPGHPAMTSLSSILYPGKAANHPDASKRLTSEELEQIFAFSPRAVYRDQSSPPEILTFDDDALYPSPADWTKRAEQQGFDQAKTLHGFLTTNNPAPEITLHGAPRMSMWPLHASTSPHNRTPDDVRSAELTSLDDVSYAFLRRDASSRHAEFYRLANRHNVMLFKLIMDQAYQVIPGYGQSLAAKYGARLPEEDYEDERDYDKDHYAIALSMFDRIRATNIIDPNLAEPYADFVPAGNQGFGTVSGLNLIGRDLTSDNGSSQQSASWHASTLEPHSAGRNYTISEVALFAYATSEITIDRWNSETDAPVFTGSQGAGSDARVMRDILSNEHPDYERWLGRKFGRADVGKTFLSIEVGLVPEIFSPSQGYPRRAPIQSIRLLTHGRGYRGGLSEDTGLKVNGVPLLLWGRDSENVSHGPLISSRQPLSATARLNFPLDWRSTGGSGGPRLLRFGRFVIDEDQPGWYGRELLPNGMGPLSHWYCQNPVIVEKGRALKFTQEAPISFLLYDQGPEGATTGNLVRTFHVRFAQPGEVLSVPGPLLNSAQYAGWTRRMSNAVKTGGNRPVSLSDPRSTESIKGLSLAHGDYRHAAIKRVIPSELFAHHPLAEHERSSHSLTWSFHDGVDAEETAKQGPESIARSLVAGVDYAREVLPDFTQDPRRHREFAPLLGENYHFPIDPTITRDFDNGLGNVADGAYINSSDDGESDVPGASMFNPKYPYFDLEPIADFKYAGISKEHHFARRMAPSPVAFGSIPSASQANAPWTCLLFRPNVSDPILFPHLGEPGNAMLWERNRITLEAFEVPQMASITGDPRYPADHLWLDLFWMPTAEPVHAASPFATQGKVNMNYQLFPYTYIKRATAMHAVLKAEEILAIPTSAGGTYKTSRINPNWRLRIDAAETLKQFDEAFAQGDLFMTESEICEQFLIPEGETWDGSGTSWRQFWDRHRLSGDNTLERPYAGLYSRLTTRSNAFRLHYRIQILNKNERSAPDRFDPEHDSVVSDHHGAKVIERKLNNESPDLPNFLSTAGKFRNRSRLESFYQVIVRDVK